MPENAVVPRVAVLDYEAGNLRSAEKALRRAGADAFVTAEAAEAEQADALLVPGVGHFGQCVRRFAHAGFGTLVRAFAAAGRPVLGVCVGLQILYETSEEAPDVPGLGVLPGRVRRLPRGLTVPHMGWNALRVLRPDPLLDGLDGAFVYFVHSYHAEPADEDQVLAVCRYGRTFPAVVRAGNIWGTQFHPEKSSRVGGRLLANFVAEVAAQQPVTGRSASGTPNP